MLVLDIVFSSYWLFRSQWT